MKNKDKEIQKPHKKEKAIVRSSAAEYLTFVAAGGGSEASVEMRYEDENIWLEGEENFVGDSEIIALGGASNETKDRPLG